MTEHQIRIFTSMLQEIKRYSNSRMHFSKFVTTLEGMFEAAEIKDQNTIDNFYRYWTPLEITNGYYADSGKEPQFSDVDKHLVDLTKFLESVLR